MKKLLCILAIALVASSAFAQNDATISPDSIQYWVGTGDNQAILIVNWCNPQKALAWGYRFTGNNVTVEDMMDDIATADSRFSYNGSGGIVNDIYYNDNNYNLSLDGMFFWYLVNSISANVGYTGYYLQNNDVIKWGDESCGVSDGSWGYVWTTPVEPVSNPNPPVAQDASISANDILYWVGTGSNEVVFITNWSNPDTALAWGYRFSGNNVSVKNMMDDIAAADYRFSYTHSGSLVTDILFQEGACNLALSSNYWLFNVNGAMSMVYYDSLFLSHNDYVKFGEDGAATDLGSWNYVWTTPATPVGEPNILLPDTLFDGPVGSDDCQAIWFEDPAILGWATGCVITRGYTDIATQNAYASYGSDSDGIGASSESTTDGVVSLGDNGVAVLTFGIPIQDGDGYDFAVFENSLNDSFLEMAFVEVSSDGEHYVRFPATSLTQTDNQITNGGAVNPREVDNLAGKHRVGWGTPFDLAQLAGAPDLNIQNITHVRLIDVVGCINPQYATRDQYGHIINDPYPTPWNSSGFDLSGVAVMNGWRPSGIEAPDAPFALLKAWPNPTTGTITLYDEHQGLERVTVHDIYGRCVMQANGEGSISVTLNLGDLPAGIYVVKANGQTRKILKK